MSKSEMKRIATLNPIAAANRIDELEHQLAEANGRADALQARITEQSATKEFLDNYAADVLEEFAKDLDSVYAAPYASRARNRAAGLRKGK